MPLIVAARGVNDGSALLAVIPDGGRPGVAMAEVDVAELDEAFPGQVIACCRDLDLARVCPEGGALALEHPTGGGPGVALLVRRAARACL